MLQARSRYFEDNKFGPDGGYGNKWVDIKLGPLPFRLRNTASRVRAVRYHDLHHVATGYKTDLSGEFEISAWEIAAGCRDFVAAWALNLAGMAGGLMRNPRRTFRAFIRGRRSRTLYGRDLDELLGRTVDDLQREMGLNGQPSRPRVADLALFVVAAGAGLAVGGILLGLGLIVGPLSLAARSLQPGSFTRSEDRGS